MQEPLGLTEPEPVKRHVLAVKNFMMGTCNLLILGLPQSWRLTSGPFPVEVDHWVRQGEFNWATSARGSYRLHAPLPDGPGRRWTALDVRVHVEPRDSRLARTLAEPGAVLSWVAAGGEQGAGGHTVRWTLGEVRRGMLRQAVPAMAFALACPVTRRQMRLTAEGEDQEAVRCCLGAMLQGLECHWSGES